MSAAQSSGDVLLVLTNAPDRDTAMTLAHALIVSAAPSPPRLVVDAPFAAAQLAFTYTWAASPLGILGLTPLSGSVYGDAGGSSVIGVASTTMPNIVNW